MKNRSNNTFTANCNEENIFLTATSPFNHSKMQPLQNPFASQKLDQIQFVRKNILDFIVEIRSSGNCPEISHMFNQILYSLDISYEGKKNINGIAQGIKQQKNLIKLTRLWNKLKYLKKDLQKLKTQKQSIQIPQKPQTCNIKFRLKPQKPATSSPFKTLPNQTKQTQQWKQKIKQQISYRQRINKIQSQSQKHEDNRHKILQKRLQKVKQMNKKVKDIYLKNKQKQRQKIHKHKYEVLFDPQTVELKKRGKTYNFQESKMGSQVDIQDINEDVLSEYQRKNQKKVTLKHDFDHKFQQTRKKMDFHLKQEERYTKQDLITFKSLKQLINQSIKGSKSFKSIARENILNMTTKPSNNVTKFSTPLNKSRSFENSKSISCKENKFEQNAIESKIMAVKEKKCQLQQERFAKIVTQAIQKEKRMLRIYQKKRLDSKTKKNSPQNQSHNSKIISHETSPTKTPFKKVFVTRKELLDKERRIFMNIQNKLQNKEYFLQQRVNRIRQRLRKQQQTRQKHQLNWQQYVSYTENVSVLQSMNTSLLKQATKLKEKQNQKEQQQVIKKAYMQKIKNIQKKGKQSKLAVLPLQELKKKLSEIQLQELKTSSKVGGF